MTAIYRIGAAVAKTQVAWGQFLLALKATGAVAAAAYVKEKTGKVSSPSTRSAPITISAICALALSAVFAPSAFMQQQGGPYTLHPSVIPAGGAASTNANTRIDGSYSLDPGFWPNAEPCPFSLSPLGEFLTQSGGPGSINVVATASCNWTAAWTDSWIVITSKENGSGNGVVTFEARENFTGSARQTAISISGTNHISLCRMRG